MWAVLVGAVCMLLLSPAPGFLWLRGKPQRGLTWTWGSGTGAGPFWPFLWGSVGRRPGTPGCRSLCPLRTLTLPCDPCDPSVDARLPSWDCRHTEGTNGAGQVAQAPVWGHAQNQRHPTGWVVTGDPRLMPVSNLNLKQAGISESLRNYGVRKSKKAEEWHRKQHAASTDR